MTDPISNERLAEMLAEVEIEFDNALSDAEADQNPQLAVDPVGEFDLIELRSILTELQSRRQSPAGVEPCATEGCENAATEHFEAGGVGSHYCKYCAAKVRSLSVKEPAGVEPAAWTLSGALTQAEAYINEYEFDDCDGGYHSPTEFERQIMIDMVNGLFSEDAFVSAVRQAFTSPPKAVTITDEASGLERAAKWVETRLWDYVHEHGSYDPSTGVTEFPGNGDEYVAELEEIAEGIRSLAAALSSEAHNGRE